MNHLLSTAYHEAGHAVVDSDHGRLAGHITIVPDFERGSAGASQSDNWDTCLENATGEEGQRAIEENIVGLFAGLEAERLVDPEANPAAAEDDYAQAHDRAKLLSLNDDDLDALRSRAADHVLRRRDVIDRLARTLLVLRTMDDWQVEGVINEVPFPREDSPGSPFYTEHMSDEAIRTHQEGATSRHFRGSIPPLNTDELGG